MIFTVVAGAHLLRAVRSLRLLVGSWQVPVALSWIGAVFAAALAAWGYRMATRGD